MKNKLVLQYQAKTEAPPAFITAVPQFESAWHQPWSEPVRQKIAPALAIALAASGLFAPILGPSQPGPSNAAPWIYPWSEPVRTKPAVLAANQPFFSYAPQPPEFMAIPWYMGLSEPVRIKPQLQVALQSVDTWDPRPPLVSFAYYNWLSEPVRLKPGLGAQYQQVDPLQTPIQPVVAKLIQWFNWLSEPVRLPIGLKVYLQEFFEGPPRVLPPANVTVTLAAKETNTDVALLGVNVYNTVTPPATGSTANVSITEIPVSNSGAGSIKES